MKIDWITDPHLDHLGADPQELVKFFHRLHHRESDALFITGDIGDSHTTPEFLGLLSGVYQRPIYFVLGNHDYYGDWMSLTQQAVRETCNACPPGILNWLTNTGALQLTEDTLIVGHDSLYDGLCGVGVSKSPLSMTDFVWPDGIHDLADCYTRSVDHLAQRLLEMAVEATDQVESRIRTGLTSDKVKRIIVLLHVPPFHKASYYRGRPSDRMCAPFYVNKTMGMMLYRVAQEFPQIQFDVYAGHTHGKRRFQAAENLLVSVGSARYNHQPTFQVREI